MLKPELGAKPRVYYLNIPKKFIAGTVYDPIEKEVIIGATCTLTGSKRQEARPPRPTASATSGSGPGRRHVLAEDRGQGLRRQDLRRNQHGEGRQPGRHPASSVVSAGPARGHGGDSPHTRPATHNPLPAGPAPVSGAGPARPCRSRNRGAGRSAACPAPWTASSVLSCGLTLGGGASSLGSLGHILHQAVHPVNPWAPV